MLFLPQKPYIPLGSLRRALSYPAAEDAYTQDEAIAALTDAGWRNLRRNWTSTPYGPSASPAASSSA